MSSSEGGPSAPSIIQKFFNIAQEKLVEVTKEKRHKVYSKNAAEYKEELQLIKPHFKPFIWGIGTAITLFASFRLSKFTGALRLQQKGGYVFDNLKRNQSKTEQLSGLSSLPIDLFLSFLAGFSASLFLIDERKLQQDLSQAPLVKGRSLLADELCADFTKEFKEIPKEFWKKRALNESSNKGDSIDNIKAFVHNCQKRNTRS
eukprot:198928_1